jgi:hypothetical protein
MTSGRLGVVAMLAAALALTGCTGTHRSAATPPETTPTPTPSSTAFASDNTTTSSIYSTMAVRHPSSWRYVAPGMLANGPGGTVAFLTNQPTVSQCATAYGKHGDLEVSCHSPVLNPLRANGVFVEFTGHFLGARTPTSHNRVLDGHLATVRAVDPRAVYCLPGATHATQLDIWLPMPNATPPGRGQSVSMLACYAGPDAAPITQDINALIDSVTFKP